VTEKLIEVMSISNSLPWKRNDIQIQPRHLLSSTFTDDDQEEYITSDYYGEERDEHATPRSDSETELDRSESPSLFSSSHGAAMDFVTFDGIWDDCNGTTGMDDVPWYFGEFVFEKSGQVIDTMKTVPKRKKAKELTSKKSRLFRVYDTERKSSTYPLQNITNTVKDKQTKNDESFVVKDSSKMKLRRAKKANPKLQQTTKDAQRKRIALELKSSKFPWVVHATSSLSTASTQSLSPTFSEDDSFWEGKALDSTSKGFSNVPYSERSVVTDGSQEQSSLLLDTKKRGLLPNNVHLRTSYWTEKNMRSYMEDRVVMDFLGTVPKPTYGVDMTVLLQKLQALKANSGRENYTQIHTVDIEAMKGPELPLSIFATFDGHAGPLASQYCSDWFSFYLQKQPSYPFDLPLALRTAFHNIDQDFLRSGNEDGTTACVCAVVGGQRVICANAGDSRAIVVKKDGTFKSLSKDHKPGSPRETKRINDLGGRVIYSGRWRVEGRLAVSRGIGDSMLKKYITPDPDICEYDICPDDSFLVVATDGIWDVLENQQIASMTLSYSCKSAKRTLCVGAENLKWTAQKLCDRAKNLGSGDNLSALVVDLQHQSTSNL